MNVGYTLALSLLTKGARVAITRDDDGAWLLTALGVPEETDA